MKVKIYITLKEGVLDPQGKAVKHALRALEFEDVEDVRQGKLIELYLTDTDHNSAHGRVADMCEKLLANTVIENYDIEISES